MLVLIIMLLCAALIFILGLFLKKGRGIMLLAGYNTMSRWQRDKIDKEELSRTAGSLMFRLALMLVLLGVSIYLRLTWATIVLIIAMVADPCIFAVRMSRKTAWAVASQRGVIVSVVISVLVLAAAGVMFSYGEKEPVISVSGDNIHIDSMYGMDIKFSDITSVTLMDKSMRDIGVHYKNNGYSGFGDTKKGHFSSNSLGDFLLFVDSGASPTILIKRDGMEDVFISFRDSEKTRALYEELAAAHHNQRT